MTTIAFLGLGNMGAPMARLLLDAGFPLRVWNRSPEPRQAFAQTTATICDTPAQAAREADLVLSMLADDDAVRAVVRGPDGIYQSGFRGVHVCHATLSIACATELAEGHATHGQSYVSCPVFGRPDAAAQKALWLVAAGPAESLTRARPALQAVSRGMTEVGADPAQANLVKLAGNLTIASLIETLGESFALVAKAGVDPLQFLDIINRLYRSPIYENYGKLVAAGALTPAGFKSRLGLKDVRLAMQAGDALEVPLPLASLLRDGFLRLLAEGAGDQDWAALGRRAIRDAGEMP
jgi:3-hydroxyisobutyrate dehydrogenase and related beta-hydroxyacid dehydrogenases